MARKNGERNINKNVGKRNTRLALEIVSNICFKSTKRDQIKINAKPIAVFTKIFIIVLVDNILT